MVISAGWPRPARILPGGKRVIWTDVETVGLLAQRSKEVVDLGLLGSQRNWMPWAESNRLSVASLISVFSGSVRSSFREGRSSVCGLAWRICGGNNSARHVCCVPPGTPLEG